MVTHRVAQGECLSSIAHRYGFAWQTLYDAPENAALRRRRPNPHVLYPGDEVHIPERREITGRIATGRQHTFRVHRPAHELRLRLRDHDHEPIAGVPWSLVLEGEDTRVEGTTGDDGLIAVPLPITVRRARLTVLGREHDLDIGGLDPVSRSTGIQQRLARLGFDPGGVDGVVGPKTRAAILAFQHTQEDLDATGRIDDATRLRLQEMCDEDGRHVDAEEEWEDGGERDDDNDEAVPRGGSNDDATDDEG